jgi:hypothetical protein
VNIVHRIASWRWLTSESSRRGVLVGMSGGVLAVFSLVQEIADTAAKQHGGHKKKHHKKKRQGSPPVSPPPVSPSPPSSPPPQVVCNAQTCASGCCVNNQCHDHNPQFCGTGGGLCVTCASGERCFSGKCTTSNVVTCPGSTCSASTCSSGGCVRTVEGDHLCTCGQATFTCTSSTQCSPGSFCVRRDADNEACFEVAGTTACMSSCSP